MRLFTAIKLDDDMREQLISAQDKLRSMGLRGRYNKEDSFHLTLAFIGEYDDPQAVTDALARVRFEPFMLRLSGEVGQFDGFVVWAGLEMTDELRALGEAVRQELSAAGIPFDQKAFNPHITLLRLARGEEIDSAPDIVFGSAEMNVEHFLLMRTAKDRNGFYYAEIGRFGK